MENNHVVMSVLTGKYQIELFDGMYRTVFGADTDKPYVKAFNRKFYLTDEQKDEIETLRKERGKVLKAYNTLL